MDEQEKVQPQPEEPTQTPDQTAPEPLTSDFLNNPDILAYIETKVQEGVQKALKGNTPKANTANLTEQERKTFEKMTYRERLNLFNSDPHTYNKLAKGAI